MLGSAISLSSKTISYSTQHSFNKQILSNCPVIGRPLPYMLNWIPPSSRTTQSPNSSVSFYAFWGSQHVLRNNLGKVHITSVPHELTVFYIKALSKMKDKRWLKHGPVTREPVIQWGNQTGKLLSGHNEMMLSGKLSKALGGLGWGRGRNHYLLPNTGNRESKDRRPSIYKIQIMKLEKVWN